jgi:acetylornithine deacetylase/succinyl-diaminopimelate desuccinylase-like protein
VPALFPAYSDNTFFRNMGVPVYGINPVYLSLEELKSVHNFNERISIDELEKGRLVYLTFLRGVIGQQQISARR